MSYLLDTCVISELAASQPNEKVVHWLADLAPEKGIEKLPPSKKKEALRAWLKDDLLIRFRGRLLPLETGEMLAWGSLISKVEAKGTPMPLIDSLIAATALHHDLVLVTRDEDDFAPSGAHIVNPWK
jgi:tRNA(fMet)-specific endonuclease VapC